MIWAGRVITAGQRRIGVARWEEEGDWTPTRIAERRGTWSLWCLVVAYGELRKAVSGDLKAAARREWVGGCIFVEDSYPDTARLVSMFGTVHPWLCRRAPGARSTMLHLGGPVAPGLLDARGAPRTGKLLALSALPAKSGIRCVYEPVMSTLGAVFIMSRLALISHFTPQTDYCGKSGSDKLKSVFWFSEQKWHRREQVGTHTMCSATEKDQAAFPTARYPHPDPSNLLRGFEANASCGLYRCTLE